MVLTSAEKSARYRAKDITAYRKKKREYAKTPSQRQKRTEYTRKWRDKNRNKHNKQAKLSHAKHRHKHIDKIRDFHYRYRYGITLEQYNNMLIAQEYKCAICLEENKYKKRFHVDHCHTTGKIRRLLCNNCNTKLGWFEKHRESALQYLDMTW